MRRGFCSRGHVGRRNNSDWVLMTKYRRLVILFFKAAAASGSGDPTITLLQAQDNTGTGSKALDVPAGMSWTQTNANLSSAGTFTAGAPSNNTLTIAGMRVSKRSG